MKFEFSTNTDGYQVIIGIKNYHDEPVIVIPDHIKGKKVVGIERLINLDEDPTSKKFLKVKKMIIPKTVEYVGDYAFTSFPFTDFEIPEDSNLIVIGRSAFMDCSNLKSIHIPARVECISEQSFLDCSNLKEITFADNSCLDIIEYKAFSGTGLEKVTLPSTVNDDVDIAAEAFANCPNLTDFDMSKASITYLGKGCCACDRKLTNISFSKTLKNIGDYAFQEIGSSNINLSDCENLAKISYGAFYKSLITNIKLPYFGCVSVSDTAFYQAPHYNIGQLLLDNPFVEIKENDIPF